MTDPVPFLRLDDLRIVTVEPPRSTDRAEDAIGSIRDLIGGIGPIATSILRDADLAGGQVYELSPESARHLATDFTNDVGGYFRGVLRGGDGKITHQVQLREVNRAPAPADLNIALLAQQAATRAELKRLAEAVADVRSDTRQILALGERIQSAELQAALESIADIHERTRRTGSTSATDWDRISNLEHPLRSALNAVQDEINDRMRDVKFGDYPGADADAMNTLRPERVAQLLRGHRALTVGLNKYYEVLFIYKIQNGEFDAEEVEHAQTQLDNLTHAHLRYETQLATLLEQTGKTKSRSVWRKLATDGLLLGGTNDERNRQTIAKGRRQIRELLAETKPPALDAAAKTEVAELMPAAHETSAAGEARTA